jgi:hypothetical protein
VECRCRWLSGDRALIELPVGAHLADAASSVRVEIHPNRFIEAPVVAAGAHGDPGRLVLQFEWTDFAAMREWWMSAYRHRVTTPPSWRRGLGRRLFAYLR